MTFSDSFQVILLLWFILQVQFQIDFSHHLHSAKFTRHLSKTARISYQPIVISSQKLPKEKTVMVILLKTKWETITLLSSPSEQAFNFWKNLTLEVIKFSIFWVIFLEDWLSNNLSHCQKNQILLKLQFKSLSKWLSWNKELNGKS